ncbi:aminopeptidase P family protein [Catelliglobosispora koreensis]|uniref:aminopeptidase P family protein n=1 Tax=Catelliglobosispora koreensis TaxID=129052 RepID=UPI0003645991|nr:aminopeptidase P family protein [Catelliglobosispora koreensis]
MTKFRTGSHDFPVTDQLSAFMRTGWLDSTLEPALDDVAPWAARRRARVASALGRRIAVAAGTFKQRANDQDYRFRADSNYVWLTGDQSSDGVVVIEADGESTLYLRPRSPRDTGEFYQDRRYGELWAGRRATLGETSARLGIATRHLDAFEGEVTSDDEFEAVLSELRLVKDEWEIAQLEDAVAITTRGFEDVVRAMPQRLGERHLEGVFWQRARLEGNDVGYHSIVASGAHAATLHWIDNDGPLRDGDLLLLDAGVENRNLYTADVTRVLPISGRFTPLQRDLYELCRAANDAALETLKPGRPYRDFHRAAMTVLANGLGDLGVLPCPVEEALQTGVYRRWTLCGSGHMLGLDLHDCGKARASEYLDGTLAENHVLTVEPGIYFQPDDGLIPPELRGMGFRIEEDILITSSGYRILSDGLPRTAADVEAWMSKL